MLPGSDTAHRDPPKKQTLQTHGCWAAPGGVLGCGGCVGALHPRLSGFRGVWVLCPAPQLGHRLPAPPRRTGTTRPRSRCSGRTQLALLGNKPQSAGRAPSSHSSTGPGTAAPRPPKAPGDTPSPVAPRSLQGHPEPGALQPRQAAPGTRAPLLPGGAAGPALGCSLAPRCPVTQRRPGRRGRAVAVVQGPVGGGGTVLGPAVPGCPIAAERPRAPRPRSPGGPSAPADRPRLRKPRPHRGILLRGGAYPPAFRVHPIAALLHFQFELPPLRGRGWEVPNQRRCCGADPEASSLIARRRRKSRPRRAPAEARAAAAV